MKPTDKRTKQDVMGAYKLLRAVFPEYPASRIIKGMRSTIECEHGIFMGACEQCHNKVNEIKLITEE